MRFLKPEILRRPHLMLTDFGGDVGVLVTGLLEQPLNRVLRLDDLAFLLERQTVPPAPGVLHFFLYNL